MTIRPIGGLKDDAIASIALGRDEILEVLFNNPGYTFEQDVMLRGMADYMIASIEDDYEPFHMRETYDRVEKLAHTFKVKAVFEKVFWWLAASEKYAVSVMAAKQTTGAPMAEAAAA